MDAISVSQPTLSKALKKHSAQTPVVWAHPFFIHPGLPREAASVPVCQLSDASNSQVSIDETYCKSASIHPQR